jgi:hypothetical protein
MSREVEHTDDGRARLLHHLGVARSAVRTSRGDDDAVAAAPARVQLAKEKDLPAPHRSRARGGPLQGGRPAGG